MKKMKDYSNFHGNIDLKEKLKRDGTELFNLTLEEGYNSHDIKIDGNEVKAVIYNKYANKNGSMYYLFTLCNQYKKGSLIEWDNEMWLVLSRPESNEVYDKAEMQLCNTSFELEGEITQVLIGNDPRTGKPIYETTESSPIQLYCVAEKTVFKSTTDEAINLPEGQILITVPYMEHKSISENEEIELYNATYQIIDVDDTESINKTGIRKLTAKRVVSTE
jgi:hypothetical protein